jgi:hypothetical protein
MVPETLIDLAVDPILGGEQNNFLIDAWCLLSIMVNGDGAV